MSTPDLFCIEHAVIAWIIEWFRRDGDGEHLALTTQGESRIQCNAPLNHPDTYGSAEGVSVTPAREATNGMFAYKDRFIVHQHDIGILKCNMNYPVRKCRAIDRAKCICTDEVNSFFQIHSEGQTSSKGVIRRTDVVP